MMRTSNPALNDNVFIGIPCDDTVMTVNGAVNKTAILLLLCVISAGWSWHSLGAGPGAGPWIAGGVIGGLITALITIFNKRLAAITAPVYVVFEGVALGAVSALFDAQYPGIVVAAVGLTFGTLACMLVAYRTGLVKATENFKLGVVAATGGICLFYVISLVLGMFNVNVPMIHSTGWVGTGFSVFVVIIAALNLVLDFDFIERGAAAAAPKYMEWYAAFGLMVTLIWLYIEILRLLAKLNRQR